MATLIFDINDVGQRCYTVSDNCPLDWRIFLSKTCPGRHYVNVGKEWKVYSSEKEMEKAMDALEDYEAEDEEIYIPMPRL